MKTFQKIEKTLFMKGYKFIAGVDEAGRGPLAGPVVAAAVIFNPNTIIEGIEDSKKLTTREREILEEEIKNKALAYSVCLADEKFIDRNNILFASLYAMRNSVLKLRIKPDLVLIDGIYSLDLPCDNKAIVKGDSKCFSIAAASILAKTYRDKLMDEYSKLYPEYNFHKNKGYPTKQHIDAILKYGHCEIHRKTFLRKIYERKFVQQKIEF